MSRKMVVGLVAAVIVVGAAPAGAHRSDLINGEGRVGPIQTNETTTSDMKAMFGEPNQKKIVRIGCSMVVSLRWDDVQVRAYQADKQRKIVDVKVLSRTVNAIDADYKIHTSRGLRVGDSEARLRELYSVAEGEPHNGHTHYLLQEDRYWNRFVAKVIDSKVVQLETAPYEYC